MPTLSRLTLAALIAGVSLAGCAHKTATRATSTTARAPASVQNTTRAGESNAATTRRHAGTSIRGKTQKLPDSTGVAACDDYLASYLGCHAAANIYAPDQLQSHYQAMRTSLLRDSLNPDIRPQLAARCNSLSTQLREALHGKPCAATPPAASSTP